MFLVRIDTQWGATGTTYDRPGFNALLEGIKRKRFDTVIVKDLSRLGRNFLKSSYYIEEFFPDNNIRFISINDNYDSFKSEDGEMLIAISNYLNGYYAKECRKKKYNYLESVVHKESFSSTGGSYGYIIENKVISVDPYASRIVRKIFKMKIEGCTRSQTAKYLTKRKFLTPFEYKKSRTGKEYVLKPWNGGMVYDILNNPIYTGDSHNLRRILVDGRIKRIPIDKRVLVKNTHTPIISKKTYALAHKDDALFTSQRGKYPFDKLNKFFIDEKVHCITGQKQKHPKFQCGRLCIYYREFYRSKTVNYYFTAKYAHEKLYAMALEVVHEIKLDPDTFFKKQFSLYKSSIFYPHNKSLYIKERNELHEKVQAIFEKSVTKRNGPQDFLIEVEDVNKRIRELDEIILKLSEEEYLKKDYERKLRGYISRISLVDESIDKLELVKAVFKSCVVIKKTIKDVTFIPNLNI